MKPTAAPPRPAGGDPNSALERRFSSLPGPQNQRRNCPMTEPQCSCDPCAAKRCVGVHPQGGWRCADEAVKELAVQRQLRIRRRHLEPAPTASITKYLSAPNPCAHAAARHPGRALGDPHRRPRALWARGVAAASARPLQLTPQGRMINSKKRKRCTNSISSALPPLSTKRGGTRAEFIAKFPQNTRVGADSDGAAG
jgi:hypothetical protein